jgi:hypothetical protein
VIVLYDSTAATLRAHSVRSLEDRVVLLRRLVWRGEGAFRRGGPPTGGLHDPMMRQIGLAVTAGCRARDDMCELAAIFQFTKENVRYTGDITDKDTFQSAWRTLQYGGGDCFPEGTLFLTRDGFEPVEQIEEGDEVHDGETWVPVLKTWDREEKEIFRVGLDNGNDLRLSATHKILRVPTGGAYGDAEEIRVADVRVGDDLLQPRRFDGAIGDELDEATAFLVGAYLAEGCRSNKKKGGPQEYLSIAGVANRKGIRERVIEILKARGVKFSERTREIKFHVRDFEMAYDLGRIAIEKALPTFRYGPKTVETIVRTMERGDGGWSTSRNEQQHGSNLVYSTISPTLALQYRVLKRLLGCSVHWKTLVDHGGAGKNPIHRLTVRAEATHRPWAKVKSITVEDEEAPCYDIMTASGRVYLPESDVITRQCDDHSVVNAVLAMENGFSTRFRITSNTGATWDHIFCLAGVPKGPNARKWIALDTTLPGHNKFGVQPPMAKYRDFDVTEAK